ncbi:MAG: sulfotransferase [Candidatus Latescibacterota bacterium]
MWREIDPGDFVTVVSGLPRSGTSMMMQMLEAGGIPALTDGARPANEDNPRGYYELERVKQVRHDKEWVAQAHGRAVKVISSLLCELPAGHRYKVVFMRRRMPEVLASQRAMLERRGEVAAAQADDEAMARRLASHLREVEGELARRPDMQVLEVWYHEVVEDPAGQAARIAAFLEGRANPAAMARACDRTLWRQRSPGGGEAR